MGSSVGEVDGGSEISITDIGTDVIGAIEAILAKLYNNMDYTLEVDTITKGSDSTLVQVIITYTTTGDIDDNVIQTKLAEEYGTENVAVTLSYGSVVISDSSDTSFFGNATNIILVILIPILLCIIIIVIAIWILYRRKIHHKMKQQMDTNQTLKTPETPESPMDTVDTYQETDNEIIGLVDLKRDQHEIVATVSTPIGEMDEEQNAIPMNTEGNDNINENTNEPDLDRFKTSATDMNNEDLYYDDHHLAATPDGNNVTPKGDDDDHNPNKDNGDDSESAEEMYKDEKLKFPMGNGNTPRPPPRMNKENEGDDNSVEDMFQSVETQNGPMTNGSAAGFHE